MPGEKFTLMQYSVNAILGLIEANDFVIPEIQRPFVWKRSQVRDLIDSLYHGYPTGYIITWKNPSVRTKDGGYSQGKKVLIDGQQRITALMAAISGKEVLDEDFKKDRIKIAFNPLAADDSKRFAVQDASHLKDKKWIPDISVLFSANFKPRAFENEYAKNNPNVDLDELADEISKLTGIANRQIGVIELDHSLDIDEVTAAEVIPEKDSTVLVYCRSGNRSKTASSTLVELGYTNIYEFGGINTWPYRKEFGKSQRGDLHGTEHHKGHPQVAGAQSDWCVPVLDCRCRE